MKRKTTLLALLILAGAASVCLAGDDAFMGTWKLNESKSKFPAGIAHNNTVVYAQSGDEVTITGDGVDGAGKPVHQVWTGKFDGKDHAANLPVQTWCTGLPAPSTPSPVIVTSSPLCA